MRTPYRLLALLALAASFAVAPKAQAQCTPNPCNGISVGAPKVFDNRSLTLQIEALQQALQRQQAANPTIDLKTVIAALANTQGLSQSEVSTVLSVLGNPTPATSVTTDLKTGNVDANGNPLPNTTDTQTSKNVASVTPAAPSFDSFASLPSGFNPAFGSSASDLLSDQVNLSYQIMNLQMILERALSDRLYTDACDANTPGKVCTRLQTVLGFNVTIDPPRTANDAVAIVEITLTREQNPGGDLSLVAMMPQEKTYNSAALSSSSHAYSGAAVVNAFQVSGGYRKRNQTFYVYRDTDTLAYERMTKDGHLVFGWMFRPVLGRRSISPGLRQLFAVLALPRVDCDPKGTNPDESLCRVNLTPHVRTYWKKFDRATQTSFERQDSNRAKRIWFALSGGLSRPEIFDKNSYVNSFDYSPFDVHSSNFYEERLSPVVEDVTWRPTGEKSVVVAVSGRNFFTGTQVNMGDTVYSEENKKLIVKSEQTLDVITTFDQLASGPSSILGRYGRAVPLLAPNPPDVPAGLSRGFKIETRGFQIGPAIDGYRTIKIPLGPHFDNTPGTSYQLAKKDVDDLTGQLSRLDIDIKAKQSDLDTQTGKLKLPPHTRPTASVIQQQSAIAASEQALDAANAQRNKIRNQLEDAKWHLAQVSSLEDDAFFESQPPIVSINGTALKMPYAISYVPSSRKKLTPGHAQIETTFPDSLITNGAALIKVSWPFYDPARWTDTLQYSDPDGYFNVERVSTNTILIRGQEIGFSPKEDASGNVLTGRENACWKFIGGDTAVELATKDCLYEGPKCTAPPKKDKPAPSTPDPGPVIQGDLYVASVTIKDPAKFPTHALLLAPDSSVYHLTIPDFPDKKPDPPKPIAMKQNDSTWIDITLDAGKTAKTVEANGAVLPATQWRVKKADSKTPATPGKKTPQTIQVEITRALTAKSGSIDVTVLDATPSVVGKQTIDIACSQCSEKKGDQ